MAGNNRTPPEATDNPNAGHEERDVNVRAVTASGLAIFGLLLVSVFGMWFLFQWLAEKQARLSPPPSAMAQQEGPRLPPEPRLQATPVADFKAIQAAEDKLMNSYGWIDPDKGTVRIPVERALEIVAQRGLPARNAPAPEVVKEN
jgi:hypothetical protein